MHILTLKNESSSYAFLSNWITTVLPAFRHRKHLKYIKLKHHYNSCRRVEQRPSGVWASRPIQKCAMYQVTWCFNWYVTHWGHIRQKSEIYSQLTFLMQCALWLCFELSKYAAVSKIITEVPEFVQKADVSDLCSAGHIFHCVGGTTNS